MRQLAHFLTGTGPLPRPATHESILTWVAGRGSGPVPRFFNQTLRRTAAHFCASSASSSWSSHQVVGKPMA